MLENGGKKGVPRVMVTPQVFFFETSVKPCGNIGQESERTLEGIAHINHKEEQHEPTSKWWCEFPLWQSEIQVEDG